ncbi:hypothetical protein CANINC_002600, partial [Pichia inconspicua]
AVSDENFAIQNFINDFEIETQRQGDTSVKTNSDLFDDDVLNEFLNPNCFQQPNDIVDVDDRDFNILQQQQQQQQQQLYEQNGQRINTENSYNGQYSNQANIAATLQDDIKRYEDAKEQ